MTFKVTIGLYMNTTSVLADGNPLPLMPSGSTHQVEYLAVYDNYFDATASNPVAFQFFAGSTLQYTGRAVPGVCKRDCTPCYTMGDPNYEVNTLVGEYLEIAERDFQVLEYDQADCVHPNGAETHIVP